MSILSGRKVAREANPEKGVGLRKYNGSVRNLSCHVRVGDMHHMTMTILCPERSEASRVFNRNAHRGYVGATDY